MVRQKMQIGLWRVADQKLVLRPTVDVRKWTQPYVTVTLQQLEPVLDDPGVLRTRLAPVFEAAATNLADFGGFDLPE